MYMAEEYENASSFQYVDAKDIVEEFEKELAQLKGKCVDIGCGPGVVTADLLLRRLSPEAELLGKGTGGWIDSNDGQNSLRFQGSTYRKR